MQLNLQTNFITSLNFKYAIDKTDYKIVNGQLIKANSNIYLQSTGTQHIDTGFVSKDCTIITDLQFTDGNSRQLMGFSGITNGFWGIYNASDFDCGLAHVYTGQPTTDRYSVTITWRVNESSSTIGMEVGGYTGSRTDTYGDDGETYHLYQILDYPSLASRVKIFSCKIIDDTTNTLARHLVPVPQGLVIGDFTCPSNGMFDIVNQQFYANQGTGDFTYGKDSVTEYDNLGFTATCEDGYNVYIDGTQYGTTYASGATCSITWSTSGITTGDDITTPSALKAHKIWIEPATEGNNITAFSCARVAASGEEQQGILWAHLNLSNEISLGGDSVDFTEVRGAFGRLQTYSNKLMKALTAKNNTIKISKLSSIFYNTSSLEYSAILDCSNNTISFYGALWSSGIPKLKIKNAKPTSLQYFAFNSGIEKLSFINCDFSEVTTFSGTFNNAQSIKALPDFNFSTPCLGGGEAFVNNCSALANDIILDLSNCTALNRFIAINTSKFKGLRVSSSAPFGGASPQINVSNTSMDRTALVQLFNDLPTVSSGQIINVTGCTGTNDLTADDKTIATAKGWTITL